MPYTDHNKNLPNGWRLVRLGDMCDMVMGRTPSRNVPEFWKGNLPWVSISDLKGEVITQTKEKITEKGAQASRSRLLKAGTLLFSFKLSIGKMAVAGIDLYTNEAIVGLRTCKSITPQFGQVVAKTGLK